MDPERGLKNSSLEVYDNVRKKLIDLLISQKALDPLVEDFDLSWVKQLKLEGGRTGHADSYVVKHAQIIKNVSDAYLLAMRLFTLMGFILFLVGLILTYLLQAAMLISYIAKLGFRYDYRKQHPKIYRAYIFLD